MGISLDGDIDHGDGNGLNNQRGNLRSATPSQNQHNRHKRVGCSSKFKGVCWSRYHNKRCAKIKIHNHQHHLGYFTIEEDAAAAYERFAGLRLNDIELIELNEAFAAQVLAIVRALDLDPARVNVNGGAIALGHPLGCIGAKLTATLLRELKARRARYGMVTMCVGGGMGAAGVFERLT